MSNFPDVRDAIIDATVKLCADIAERSAGYISCDEQFSRGYMKGRQNAAAEIRAAFTKPRKE